MVSTSNLHTLPGMLSSLLMSLKDSIKKLGSVFHMQSRGCQRRSFRVLETTLWLMQFKFLFTLRIATLSSLLLGLLPTKPWRWFFFKRQKEETWWHHYIPKKGQGVGVSRAGWRGWRRGVSKLVYGSGFLRLHPAGSPPPHRHACHPKALDVALRLTVQALS